MSTRHSGVRLLALRDRLTRLTPARAALAALLSLAAFAVVRHIHGFTMVDMLVYRAEGRAGLELRKLYALLGGRCFV